ncbi:hypothetical protein DW355_13545 [Hylemonella gracilis]|uniref:Lipoprotein n=1 Tax=Hylemonella gracilis TaxID=80880 RepID=A0A4P6UJS4_9BURK|nr:hypothetical protein [Hylemonella gracilis]QBK05618.1 hypothetical protein DW355_13545 [Hylemonella gracilis]
MKLRFSLRILAISSAALLLAACDIPGVAPDPRLAMRESDSKAIGNACRYALRGLEECYTNNPKALKTAILEGWREMDQYMRENDIKGQAGAPVEAQAQAPLHPQGQSGPEVKNTEGTKSKAATDKKSGIRL